MDNRLDDFPADRFGITVFCEACGHSAELDRQPLSGRLPIHALTARLRCSVCGSRGGVIRIGFKLASAQACPRPEVPTFVEADRRVGG